jgi:UDP-glucose:(heptosyl)LPS alpha-1,3-glucosyltransferase
MERAYGRAGARWRRLSPRHALLLAIEERVFADASQVVLCNSAMVRDEIAARYAVPEARLVVLPNGVDLERFRPGRRAALGAPLRTALGDAAPDTTVWLLLGSGFHRKGVDTALRALAGCGDPAARLWIAGADPPATWRRLAERLGVAGRVRFLGLRDDTPALCAAADGFLLPTRYDAFANACLEAAAAGLPVVTSGANGAAAWLGAGARVVEDPEDAQGFAKALDDLADPQRRATLGAAARARAEETGWERHVEALRALYLRIAR